MTEKSLELEEIAAKRCIAVHDALAEHLKAKPALHTFEISLLDCYRLAGHACHSMTGAFLITEMAVQKLFPESRICERGDLIVEMNAGIDEGATGPKSNVISYITGAWANSGFQGIGGKFARKDLLSYNHSDLAKNAVRFRRKSTEKTITLAYDPSPIIAQLHHQLPFPDSWRVEIVAVLNRSNDAIKILATEILHCSASDTSTLNPNGCC